MSTLLNPFFPYLGFLDEAILVLCISSLIYRKIFSILRKITGIKEKELTMNKGLRKLKIVILIYFLYEVFLAFNFREVTIVYGLIQSLISIKIFVFILYFAEEKITPKKMAWLKGIAFFFVSMMFFFTLVDLVFRESFHSFFGMVISYRSGLLRTTSFFPNPGTFGDLSAVLFLAVVAIKIYEKYLEKLAKKIETGKIKTIIATILSSFFIFASLVRKPIIGIFTALIAYYSYSSLRTKIRVFVIAPLVIMVVTPFLLANPLIWGILETYYNDTLNQIDNEEAKRNILMLQSLKIAYDYFPFGSGPGTYLSLMSLKGDMSNIYRKYHLNILVNPDFPIFDSNLASIIAEHGAIGLIIFSAILFLLGRECYKKKDNYFAWYGFGLVFYTIAVFPFSPIITSSITGFVIGAIIGLGINQNVTELEKEKIKNFGNSKPIAKLAESS